MNVSDPFDAGDELPGGIEALATGRARGGGLLAAGQRTLAVGNVLIGRGSKKPRSGSDLPLRLCPESWLAKETHAELRDAMRPLLDLPIQRIAMSHGEPVLHGAKRALERVLAG